MFQFHFLKLSLVLSHLLFFDNFFLYSILIGLENNQGRTFRHAPLFLKLFLLMVPILAINIFSLFEKRLKKIAKMQNLSQNEFN